MGHRLSSVWPATLPTMRTTTRWSRPSWRRTSMSSIAGSRVSSVVHHAKYLMTTTRICDAVKIIVDSNVTSSFVVGVSGANHCRRARHVVGYHAHHKRSATFAMLVHALTVRNDVINATCSFARSTQMVRHTVRGAPTKPSHYIARICITWNSDTRSNR